MNRTKFETAQNRPLSLNEAETNAFIQASKAILGAKDFHETARIIFNQARSITGATAGYVALLTADGEENEVLFLESGHQPCSVDPSLPMPIRGLRAESYKHNVTVYDNNFGTSDYAAFMPDGHVPLANVMFAPLVIDKKTVGIIGLANKPANFTPRDADLATAFGELAAIALSNSNNIGKLTSTMAQLEKALAEVRRLQGIIPICMKCKSIRDDQGLWNQLEKYISEHSEVLFSHALCPKCLEEYMHDLEQTP